MDDFKKLAKGVPNHVVARLLSQAAPGVDFTGSTKTIMAECWANTGHTYRIDREKFATLTREWRREQVREQAAACKNALSVKPGDEVTMFTSRQLCDIRKVVAISTSVISVDAGDDQLWSYSRDGKRLHCHDNADRNSYIVPTTAQHRDRFHRENLIYCLKSAPWEKLATGELETLVKRYARKGELGEIEALVFPPERERSNDGTHG